MNKHATVRDRGQLRRRRGREHDVRHRGRRGQRVAIRGRDRPRRAAGDPRRRLGALRDLAEGRRHRRARLGRPHERVHGPAGDASWSAATPATRSATRCTRRGCTCAARSPALGADCVEKEMRDEHVTAGARAARRGPEIDDVDPSEFRRYGSARRLYNFHVDNLGQLLMAASAALANGWHPGSARVGDVRPQRDRRDPARRARGHVRHPRVRRQAARAALRRPAVPRAPACPAIRSRATASGATPTS